MKYGNIFKPDSISKTNTTLLDRYNSKTKNKTIFIPNQKNLPAVNLNRSDLSKEESGPFLELTVEANKYETHLISDIERILDEVIFIDSGKIILHEECDKLRKKEKDSITNII